MIVEGKTGDPSGIRIHKKARNGRRRGSSGRSLPRAGSGARPGAARRTWRGEQGSRSCRAGGRSFIFTRARSIDFSRSSKGTASSAGIRREITIWASSCSSSETCQSRGSASRGEPTISQGGGSGDRRNSPGLRPEQHTDDGRRECRRAVARARDWPSGRIALVSVGESVPGIPAATRSGPAALARYAHQVHTQHHHDACGIESRAGASPQAWFFRQRRGSRTGRALHRRADFRQQGTSHRDAEYRGPGLPDDQGSRSGTGARSSTSRTRCPPSSDITRPLCGGTIELSRMVGCLDTLYADLTVAMFIM